MYYFFNTIKKYIIGTLSVFDNTIIQKSDGRQSVVPVVFAGKERLNQYIATEFQKNRGAKVIPKIAVGITGMTFDQERKSNKMSKMPVQYSAVTSSTSSMYNSVPYNWTLEVHIITRTLSDMFQILEQTLPKFNPSISINIYEINNVTSSSVPLILNDVNLEIDSDLDEMSEQRYIRATIGLTLKGNIFMPLKNAKVIKKINLEYSDMSSNLPDKYILQ